MFAQLKKAIDSSVKHRKAFNDFNKLFPAEVINEWSDKVRAWDSDMSKPNPYAEPIAGKHLLGCLLFPKC